MDCLEEDEKWESIEEMLDDLDVDPDDKVELPDIKQESGGCLHESLSRQTPDHLDGAHMLACPCPQCTPRC